MIIGNFGMQPIDDKALEQFVAKRDRILSLRSAITIIRNDADWCMSDQAGLITPPVSGDQAEWFVNGLNQAVRLLILMAMQEAGTYEVTDESFLRILLHKHVYAVTTEKAMIIEDTIERTFKDLTVLKDNLEAENYKLRDALKLIAERKPFIAADGGEWSMNVSDCIGIAYKALHGETK